MNVFEKDLADSEKTVKREIKNDFWIKLFTLGFCNNSKRIEMVNAERIKCQQDYNEFLTLHKDAKILDEETIELSSLHNVRISSATFADISSTSLINYPLNWEELRREILDRDEYSCQEDDGRCQGPLQIHHKMPLSQGGSNDHHNLITLCKYHHCLKHPHMHWSSNGDLRR